MTNNLKNKKIIVTGCAGFIGSNLVDHLLKFNNNIIGLDNLSTGQKKFIDGALKNKNFKFIKCDLLNLKKLKKIIRKVDIVFHFAANADVRYGPNQTHKDLEQNTIVTYNVLEAMTESYEGLSELTFMLMKNNSELIEDSVIKNLL